MLRKWLIALWVGLFIPYAYAMQQQTIQVDDISYDVIKVEHLQQLRLFLKNPNLSND